MCGIAGIFSKRRLNSNILTKMSEGMRHRGPDSEGYVIFNETGFQTIAGVDTPDNYLANEINYLPKSRINNEIFEFNQAFIHRRLSIIDLNETGHQPMCNAESTIWITYNGEIYNYLELRTELEIHGFKFRSNSDTEVIIAAYLHWGEDCLNHFNGMWAFALADLNQNKLFLARDRFGVKPLYYFSNQEHFIFASEQKTLLHSELIQREVNPNAVFDYFALGEIEYEPEGFFKNILELMAGYSISTSLSNPEPKPHKWYKLTIGYDNVANYDKITNLLEESIKLRLRADVDVGSCLSGGLDSSAIVGFMNDILAGKKFHVFTASFPNNKVDESHWAKIAAENTTAIQHDVTPTLEGLSKEFEDLSYAQDIPIWSTSTYAQFSVMKMVQQQGIRVVLDGQGGDEVFAGYHPHLYFYLKDKSWSERFSFWNKSGVEGFLLPFYMKQWMRFDGIYSFPNDVRLAIYEKYFNDFSYLNKDFRRSLSSRLGIKDLDTGTNLNTRLAFEMQNTSLKAYLKCEDRCSMWHSVESRTPFADDFKLIEYIFSLSPEVKLQDGNFKFLLRKAMQNKVDRRIINRRDKQGYTTPNKQWISQLAPSLEYLFDDSLKPFLNVKKLKNDYSKLFSQSSPVAENRLFKFLSFALWHKLYFKDLK